MKNSIIKFTALLVSTILVFIVFILGIVLFFIPKNSNDNKLRSLSDYVDYVISHKEYDDEFIGEYIIENNLDLFKSYSDKLCDKKTSSLKDTNEVNDEYVHNGSDIDKSIEINNKLSISNSIVTNIKFSYPDKERTLNIKNSIVGINIDNIQTINESKINLNIDNSFIYIQANNSFNNGTKFPILKGNISNSLIGNRINYENNQDPFYFLNINRGDMFSNSQIDNSYYDIINDI